MAAIILDGVITFRPLLGRTLASNGYWRIACLSAAIASYDCQIIFKVIRFSVSQNYRVYESY